MNELMKTEQKKVRLAMKTMQTCQLGNYVCGLIRRVRFFMPIEFIASNCRFVGDKCKEYGCKEAGEACFKAVEALENKAWKKYVELCLEASKLHAKKVPTPQGMQGSRVINLSNRMYG